MSEFVKNELPKIIRAFPKQKREIPQIKLILNSASGSAGLVSRDLTKSEFVTQIVPFQVPIDSNPYVYLYKAQIWNHFITISTALGNNKIYYTNDAGTPDKYSITIPDGYWSDTELSNQINVGVIANSHTSGLISCVGQLATQKIIWTISASGWQVYFKADSPYSITGNTLLQKIPAGGLTTASYSETSPNVADFSACTSILVTCSLVSGCTTSGSVQKNILDSVVPDVGVGSLINYQPQNISPLSAPLLRGDNINGVTIKLTNETGGALSITEDFSLEVCVGW